jgi:putative flippase GtrA
MLPWAKITRFGIVGSGVTALNFLLYVTLIGAGFHYLAATGAGWATGVAVSFFLNKHYTFLQPARPAGREVNSFLTGYVLQLLLGSLSLAFLVEVARIDCKTAFFLNVPITALFSYLFMDRIVFAARERRLQ